jgi:hypothetical protein
MHAPLISNLYCLFLFHISASYSLSRSEERPIYCELAGGGERPSASRAPSNAQAPAAHSAAR